jgi:hypothetical protein
MEFSGNELVALFFLGGIFSGVFLIFMAMKMRSESLEREHRERMAMIERGQVPPASAPGRRGPPAMAMSLGIIIVGFGLGLMMLIAVASGETEVGIGVGGAIVILGAAFIVRSLVVRPAEAPARPVPPPPLPPRTSEEP